MPRNDLEEVFLEISVSARSISQEASPELFVKAVQNIQSSGGNWVGSHRSDVLELLGRAHLVCLELEKAAQYFRAAGDDDLLETVFRLALRHGRVAVVDALSQDFTLEPSEYEEFLWSVAIPRFHLHRHPSRGFWIDEEELFDLLGRLPGEPHENLARVVRLMEGAGDGNIVKKYIFSKLSRDEQLVAQYEGAFNHLASVERSEIPRVVEAYCARVGWRYEGLLQQGDPSPFFPKSSYLFVVSRGDEEVVLKENLRLPLDYSRLGSYSLEKEVLEYIWSGAGGEGGGIPDGFVKYLGDVEIPGTGAEFLVLELVKGRCLEEFTVPGSLLSPRRVLEVLRAVAVLLEYLHARGVVYMDVKAKNFIARDVGEGGAQPPTKVTMLDFGMSQFLPVASEPDERGGKVYSLLSTPRYVPPEMATAFSACISSDIFQLGILAHELVTGTHPFARVDFLEGDEYRRSELLKFTLANACCRPNMGHERYGEFQGIVPLVQEMLNEDPGKRPTAAEVVGRLEKIMEEHVE
ncbi:MAG: protein kinase domain-containing protein [Promethearchaeota archaeon]